MDYNKKIKENPKALYFHCAGHQLNLVCQDACTGVYLVPHVIIIVNKIVTFVKVAKALFMVRSKLLLENLQRLIFDLCATQDGFCEKTA